MNIAMPVAHVNGSGNYSEFYSTDTCVFSVQRYFNRSGAQGINLIQTFPGASALDDDLWDLFSFTEGFISFQNNSVVLRLPLLLNNAAVSAYQSGLIFRQLKPIGPQLRHVVYAFSAHPGAAVEDKIRAILSDATHPGQNITRIAIPGKSRTEKLKDFLAADPKNIDSIISQFMSGTIELFVRGGNVIGNFKDLEIEIQFKDSCGSLNPPAIPTAVTPPRGRPLNPSYYLYLVRSTANAANVNLLTTFGSGTSLQSTHPLDHLFSQASVSADGGNPDQILDMTRNRPPRPLHVTIDVQDESGVTIADSGIRIEALTDWHESRNAANPYKTRAPVQWRNYGSLTGDNVFGDFGKFLTRVKSGRNSLLPGGTAFDHQHTPAAIHNDRVRAYWERYAVVFNAVANAFEIPCELLIAIACQETSTGRWFDPTFAGTHEMDTIRMEPLKVAIADFNPSPTHLGFLNRYLDLAGGVGGTHADGANANIPDLWNGARSIRATGLTWGELQELVEAYPGKVGHPGKVGVSPGIMQVQVSTAVSELDLIDSMYGNTYVHQIAITHNGVQLTADDPPNSRRRLFSDWFGVSVDAAGNNTARAADVNTELTKMKRALHDIIAGASHIKHFYNTVWGGKNFISDLDLPTVASAYNDGANPATPASSGPNQVDQWHRLFALVFAASAKTIAELQYPKDAPKFFNAAVAYFNTDFGVAVPALPRPALRLWRS